MPEMKPSDINALRKAPPLFWAICIGGSILFLFSFMYYNAGWENTVSFFGGLLDTQRIWFPFISWFFTFFAAGLTVAVTVEKRLDKFGENSIIHYALAELVSKRLLVVLGLISFIFALVLTRLVYTGYEWIIMLLSIATFVASFYRKRAQI
ncbi:MAG: hypothetical protein ABH854_00400 [Candidatus Diapherotrites archaeon]|nr:hypothetical protein [Candidatus Micrarchaeota archaeon]MBU1939184.1 hypothetical protein [Candidatus Micrarchaeota archaeon]